ncbi:hypothetical protein Bca4012_020228 [Brassica carinata]|uniref:Uncharacterized protein n=1 Tax=Brassica carinata TaxID=52824 RepID=A0A8X7WG45_BRACI|nr:hypothetical protein Bca52824_001359 [Brassica carinata]
MLRLVGTVSASQQLKLILGQEATSITFAKPLAKPQLGHGSNDASEHDEEMQRLNLASINQIPVGDNSDSDGISPVYYDNSGHPAMVVMKMVVSSLLNLSSTSPIYYDLMNALTAARMRKAASLTIDGGSNNGLQRWLRCDARRHEGRWLQW